MNIHIEDLKFKTIIGILDFEREKPQDVIINLKIEYDYSDKFINYVDVSELVKKLMLKNKFLLIEEALDVISTELQKKFSQINLLDLKITKPSILSDCKVSVSNKYNFNS